MPTTTTRARHAAPRVIAALLGALASFSSLAAPYPNIPTTSAELRRTDWFQQCLRVAKHTPPAKDLIRPVRADRCDATELYYDARYQTDPDWKQVRECAVQNNDVAVLMMLYANGAGVAPNLNLATKYACSLDSPAGEMKARLASLRRKGAGASASFDLCDDVASGERRGLCSAARERQRDKQRAAQLAAASRHWTPKEQLGFEIATKALRYYAQSRFDHETDQSASAKGTLQVEAMAAELDQFVIDVADFESGKLPRFSEAEYQSLDDKLQQTYQQFMAARPSPTSYLGTIRKTGVEKTQRAWLAYRDAMELFGAMKYPAAPSSGWKALVTSRRLRQLSELDNAAAGR